MKITFKVEGLADTEKALQELIDATSSRTGKTVIRRALKEAAEPMAEAARARVSKRSGKLAGSIAVGTQLENSVGKRAFAEAKRSGLDDAAAVKAMRDAQRAAKGTGSQVTVHVGPSGAPARRAHFTEFGTKPHVIRSRKPGGRGKLVWAGQDGTAAAREVRHPGSPPKPFLRPAMDGAADQVLSAFKPKLAAHIEKSAQAAARRAARKKG